MDNQNSRALKVLVVDDMASMRMFIRAVLNKMRIFDVLEARNGQGALKVLAEKDNIDLVICDWNMPGMTGLEVLRAVRANPELNGLPVLMVTAEKSQAQVKDAVIAGVTGYVAKPFTPEVLEAHIEACLRKRVRSS